LELDFYVTSATKLAFKEHFHNSLELFQLFRLLYELNANFISEEIKKEVYMSKGFYTDGKLPVPSPDENVFYFLDFKILKKIRDCENPKELLLREFSDGEHQFLHTMGICLLLKNRRTLLLLDEPETHFNPNWRTKFIKLLCDSIESDNDSGNNVHLLKDIILTSHSPFIISDCLPDNVILFSRNHTSGSVEAHSAKELGINTYGASVDFILRNFFNASLVSAKSLSELKDVIERGNIDDLQQAIDKFGESYDKQFLFKRIYEKMMPGKDDSSNRKE
jgi:restriction system-associated AAA family ATPase